MGQNYGNISDCSSTGNITGGFLSVNVGGLVGWNTDNIISCFSTGDVNGGDSSNAIGGLVGYNKGSISNCFAIGSANGTGAIGGLVGKHSNGIINNSYSTGTVSGRGSFGGLVGSNTSSISSSYFLITSGPDNGFGTPLTDTQMKHKTSFVSWDFVGETVNGYDDIWRLCNEGMEYPKLAWQYLSGDIACPDGVDNFDLAELCEQWLFYEIPADLAPLTSDGIVDFTDFSVFADQWGITNYIDDLLDFTGQWLKTGLPVCSADISPLHEGDSHVDADDFAFMANDWLEGF